ncbi:MAG TPA: two-component sensor histidine kinase [Eubacterium sp.]|nr:two-component sensor histidine kinase [Eubacterium sp.]HAV91466.1 two-component sensor histidine kinase [Eubacterium sp.]
MVKMNNETKVSKLKSIRFRILAISVFIIVVTIALILLANNLFLEKFYIKQKEKSVVDIYNKIKMVYINHDKNSEDDENNEIFNVNDVYFVNTLSEEEQNKIDNICENGGVTLLAEDEKSCIEYYFGPAEILKKQLDYNIYNVSLDGEYVLNYFKDNNRNDDHVIELYGCINEKHYMIIRVATQNIKDSVDVFNNFFMYAGLVAILLSIILIFIATTSFTKPILKLAKLSEKMSNLDFSTKYESRGKDDEVDVLGNSMNNLSNKLEMTISELKTANEQLQEDIKIKTEVDEMRKEFISNVSHELKTPIALISGYAEGLIDGVNEDPESQKVYCEIIADEASKMNKMVKKLLTLNKIEFGKIETYPDKFDIISVICGILGNTQIMLEENNISVVFAENNSYMIYADEFQTEEVITNFISNAINHCMANSNGRKIIKIDVMDIGDKVKVNVFNTGNPIPDEELEKIWIKFYKVDKARTREYGGSGIGLSIVKAITNSMGTECGAVNEKDGVSFFATFNKPKENDNDSNN